MNPSSAHRPARGLSLVELMVAIAVSLVLLAGVYQIYMATKTSYRMDEGLARLQENARFALEFLARDIRMAGYMGCYTGAPGSVESILASTDFAWDFGKPVEGHEYTGSGGSADTDWNPSLGGTPLSGKVSAYSDVVIVRRMAGNGVRLVPPYSDSAQLFIDPAYSSLFQIGDILMVTDCTKASIFQATNIQPAGGKINVVHSAAGTVAPGNSTPLLGNSYGADAEVAKFITHAYFVGPGVNGPALMRARLQNSSGTATTTIEELVEGVESLQVLYGVDSDGDGVPNQFLERDAVTDMADVVAVRVGLLLRTPEEVPKASAAPSTTLLGESITPSAPDRRLRRTAVVTVGIRNRLP